jgi:anti-anti-sigma factor
MSAWILRFSDKRFTIGPRKSVAVLHFTADGNEVELEVLEGGWEEEPGLRGLVRGQIDKGRSRMILDLGTVERVDSNGVGEIVAVSEHARNQGGVLALANLQPGVRDIFKILYLDKVILIFDSISEAVDYLTQPQTT